VLVWIGLPKDMRPLQMSPGLLKVTLGEFFFIQDELLTIMWFEALRHGRVELHSVSVLPENTCKPDAQSLQFSSCTLPANTLYHQVSFFAFECGWQINFRDFVLGQTEGFAAYPAMEMYVQVPFDIAFTAFFA